MQALRMYGGHKSCFLGSNKGLVDLMPKLPDSYQYTEWNDLKGKFIRNKTVILSRYGDIHPYANGPRFLCDTLFLDGCDKNFLAYWLNRRTFPVASKIYIGSHPCDHYVLKRMSSQIYLHEFHSQYKDRWWRDLDNIEIISDADYKKAMESYGNENINMACE